MPESIDQTIEDNERFVEGGMETAIRYIQRDIASINQKLDDKYVTKGEFVPVRNVVYGLRVYYLSRRSRRPSRFSNN